MSSPESEMFHGIQEGDANITPEEIEQKNIEEAEKQLAELYAVIEAANNKNDPRLWRKVTEILDAIDEAKGRIQAYMDEANGHAVTSAEEGYADPRGDQRNYDEAYLDGDDIDHIAA